MKKIVAASANKVGLSLMRFEAAIPEMVPWSLQADNLLVYVP